MLLVANVEVSKTARQPQHPSGYHTGGSTASLLGFILHHGICTKGSPASLLGFPLHHGIHTRALVTPEFARPIPQGISPSFFNSSNLYLHLEAKPFLSEVAC